MTWTAMLILQCSTSVSNHWKKLDPQVLFSRYLAEIPFVEQLFSLKTFLAVSVASRHTGQLHRSFTLRIRSWTNPYHASASRCLRSSVIQIGDLWECTMALIWPYLWFPFHVNQGIDEGQMQAWGLSWCTAMGCSPKITEARYRTWETFWFQARLTFQS